MNNQPTPLFLFSLPRSGSTLCQRILGTDPRIATASEPWLLLPSLYALRRRGVYAEYDHLLTVEALEDFCAMLPLGQDDYLDAVRGFAAGLYAKASPPGARYFLDKTPRYSLVAGDICRTFPDAKFLFLWRNPLAIIASIIETWGKGRWYVFRFNVDLFQGLENLIEAYQSHADVAHAFRYEDILADPETHWRKLYAFLELPFNPCVLTHFTKTHLNGRMGDQTGIHYDALTSEPLRKWESILANPFRKFWCRRYLRWIGAERLALMGYDLPTLLQELHGIRLRPKNLASDLCWAGTGLLYDSLEMRMVRDKVRCLPDWRRIHPHR